MITNVLKINLAPTNDAIRCAVQNDGFVEDNFDFAVPGGSTDLEFAIDLPVADLSQIYLVSSQDVTIKANDDGSPDFTITLKADEPLVWRYPGNGACPFTDDITALFFTRASGAAATVRLRTMAPGRLVTDNGLAVTDEAGEPVWMGG